MFTAAPLCTKKAALGYLEVIQSNKSLNTLQQLGERLVMNETLKRRKVTTPEPEDSSESIFSAGNRFLPAFKAEDRVQIRSAPSGVSSLTRGIDERRQTLGLIL